MTVPVIHRHMGSVAALGDRPHSFATGLDNHIWVNFLSGETWEWADRGVPPGVKLLAPMGVVTADAERPYLFVTGDENKNDGKGEENDLWVNWWSGRTWGWDNRGRPRGVQLGVPMGAVIVDKNRPHVYVRAGDGNLWVHWWSGTTWAWKKRGRPPGGVTLEAAMGAATVDDKRAHVFVKGSDGNLWVHWGSGETWAWDNRERPPGGVTLKTALGVVSVAGNEWPYVFVKGSDGNLWINHWTGTIWEWSNWHRPPGVTLKDPAGATTVDGGRPYVFVTGGAEFDSADDNLWLFWWTGAEWAWKNQGRPRGSSQLSSNGAITIDGGRPYAFVTVGVSAVGSGKHWVRFWSGTHWIWAPRS